MSKLLKLPKVKLFRDNILPLALICLAGVMFLQVYADFNHVFINTNAAFERVLAEENESNVDGSGETLHKWLNDSSDRCQNKLGVTASESSNGGAFSDEYLNSLKAQLKSAYLSGARYASMRFNSLSEADIANATSFSLISARYHLTPIVINAKTDASLADIIYFYTTLSDSLGSIEVVANTLPLGRDTSDMASAISDMEYVAAALKSVKNIVVGTAVLPANAQVEGINLGVFNLVLLQASNKDVEWGVSDGDAGKWGYGQYLGGAYDWISKYNEEHGKFVQAMIVDYSIDTNSVQQDYYLERISYDYGHMADEETIAAVVLPTGNAGFSDSDIYQINLNGTNCPVSVVSYGDEYAERSTAELCGSDVIVSADEKAKAGISCVDEWCMGSLFYTVKVGLPIKFLGSNNAVGTNTEPFTPIQSTLSSLVQVVSGQASFNQFSSEIVDRGGAVTNYSMPLLGNVIASGELMKSLLAGNTAWMLDQRILKGLYPTNAESEKEVVMTLNNPMYVLNNDVFTSDKDPYLESDSESTLCVNNICLDKVNRDLTTDWNDNILQTAFEANTGTQVNACGGDVPRIIDDPQDMIYGPESYIDFSKFVWVGSLSQLCYEAWLGKGDVVASNEFIGSCRVTKACRCDNNANLSLTRSNIQSGRCTAGQETVDACIGYSGDESKLADTSTSGVTIQKELPNAPTFDLPGIQETLASMYTKLTDISSNLGIKFIFKEKTGMAADVVVRAYDGNSSVSVGMERSMKTSWTSGESSGDDSGSETNVDAAAATFNQMCASGITPIVRSCTAEDCFSSGADQGTYYVSLLKQMTRCSGQDVYMICGHNEPNSEYPPGFAAEARWTKACVQKVQKYLASNSVGPNVKITTPTFNITAASAPSDMSTFISVYGGGDKVKNDFDCVAANTYDNVVGGESAASYMSAVSSAFPGIPICIMETGNFANGNIAARSNPDLVRLAAQNVLGYSGSPVTFALLFNGMGTNGDPAFKEFRVADMGQSAIEASGGRLGINFASWADQVGEGTISEAAGYGYKYALAMVTGGMATNFETKDPLSLMPAGGDNYSLTKEYYEELGNLNEIVKLIDILSSSSVSVSEIISTDGVTATVKPGITEVFAGWLSCDDPVAIELGLNCIAPYTMDVSNQNYVVDPLGEFLCNEGYDVEEQCGLQCIYVDPGTTSGITPTGGSGVTGGDTCPTPECPAEMAAGQGGVSYPECNGQIQVTGTGANTPDACDYWQKQVGYFGDVGSIQTGSLSSASIAVDGDGFLGMSASIPVNTKVIDIFLKAEQQFNEMYGQNRQGSTYYLPSYPNGYTFTFARSFVENESLGAGYSNHAFGVAIDLNVNNEWPGNWGNFRPNQYTCAIDIPPELVQVFEANGIRWGGRFSKYGWQSGRTGYFDPMHFEIVPGCTDLLDVELSPLTSSSAVNYCAPESDKPTESCNEFNCFNGSTDFYGALDCAASTLSNDISRGYELDRIIDEYGPYCDNETVYYGNYFMPFAYNLFTEIYDKYLPVGSSGGRICKGELRSEPREADINMMCGNLGSPSRLPGDPIYDYYRGALSTCGIDSKANLGWTSATSKGMSAEELAQWAWENVSYQGMRLSDTPIQKVVEVMRTAKAKNVNPFLLLGIWATESWFGQSNKACNVYYAK